MAKMGYVFGEGLGKDKDGIVNPVAATRVPKGASLDNIMELRSALPSNCRSLLERKRYV